jgi:UDP-2,4-diacetamido-2,4,6-trideoxy-beta-L-altropyranose hydrolase
VRALNVVIRTDASATIGLGHAMRCVPLAEVLCGAGHHVVLASAAMPTAVEQRYAAIGARAVSLDVKIGTLGDADATAQVVRDTKADWLVADGYAFNQAWQIVVRAAVPRLLMIDDEATRPAWHADVIVNPNFGTTLDRYAKSAPQAVVLAGAPYALIRSEFIAWRSWPRPHPLLARNVLVTLGGADPGNHTAQLISVLQSAADLSVRVIVGATNPHRALLRTTIDDHAESAQRISLLDHVEDMPSQMAWADVAISAGGTTLWELAAMRLPALVVQLAENQRNGLNAYVGAGAARFLGVAESLQNAQVYRMVTALCDDDTARLSMSRATGALIDGGGPQRVRALMEAW